MRPTWRWFGPGDAARIDEIGQAGAEGVVTALHDLPPGAVWSLDDIRTRQDEVRHFADGEPSGLEWEVVESLPVSDDIKRQQGEWRSHVAHYKISLEHLAEAGIRVVCYNFMPVLDWTRTDLAWRLPNGATCLRFDAVDFAAFDIHLLARRDAPADYTPAVVNAAARRFASMDEARKTRLVANIVAGLPGSATRLTLANVRGLLAGYDEVPEDRLRTHLVDFLSEVAPVAERLGVRLCCHPDDPPWPLLGLPRVMSTEADYRHVLDAVNLEANGVTFCTGSFGARPDHDVAAMASRLASRIHFAHLRNVVRETEDGVGGSFHEAPHLEGDVDMVAVMAVLVAEERRRAAAGRLDCQIPMRPDHGLRVADDAQKESPPGYPVIGRLKGLAELRGVMRALEHEAGWRLPSGD